MKEIKCPFCRTLCTFKTFVEDDIERQSTVAICPRCHARQKEETEYNLLELENNVLATWHYPIEEAE